MLIGYTRVSKADGSQLLELQRDALLDAGVDEERIYEDRASGRHDHRPGLEVCLIALEFLLFSIRYSLSTIVSDFRFLLILKFCNLVSMS